MREQEQAAVTDIAIIGMALRVPGANTVEQFWRNLTSGVESIRSLTREELWNGNRESFRAGNKFDG